MSTNSTVTYVPELVGDLDVTPLYKEFMEASTGQGSVYIRAKETLVDMFATTTFTAQEKSTVIAQTISSIATGMSAKALDAAIKVATENRDAKYVLTKLREDTKLTTAQAAKIEADIAQIEINKDLSTMKGWQIQAELFRDYGVNSYNLTAITPIVPQTAYADYGVKVETLKKAKVDTYATYANAYRTNGNVSYSTDATTGQFVSVSSDSTGLTYAQEKVAIRQEQGFDDNQRQHVANSSASMIGLLLSTEASGIDYDPYLASWNESVSYLNTSHTAIVQIGGSVDIVITDALSATAEHTISGTVTGISAGRSVTLVYKAEGESDVQSTPGLVLLDNSWSSVLPLNKSADLVVGVEYTITASIVDHTGKTVKDTFTQTVVA